MSAISKKTIKLLDGSMYLFVILSCIAVPLVMDSSLINPFVLPKQLTLSLIAMIGIALWLVRSIVVKKISFYQSTLDKLFAPFCGALLLSVIFSEDRLSSLTGRSDYFAISFLFLISGWIIFSFINHTITSLPRWQGVLDTLMGVGAITALGVVAKVIFKADILSFITAGRWSTVDPTNSLLAVWLVTLFLIAASQLIKKGSPTTRTVLSLVTMTTTFITILAMNYTIIWWFLIVGLALFIFVSIIYIREVRLWALTTLFGIIVGIIIMLALGVPKITETSVPTEIVLNSASSWTVVQGSVFSGLKNSLVGNGLGTFPLAFSHFRDSTFNNDAYAWSIRFNQPHSTFAALVAEGGLVVGALFLVLLLYVLGLFSKAIKNARAKQGDTVEFFADGSSSGQPLIEVLLIGVVWFLVTAGMFVFFYGPVMWWLWWVLLSCLVIGLSFTEENFFVKKEHRLADKPEYTLSLSFIAISVVALMAVGVIWSTRWYFSEIAYARAYASDDTATVEKEMQRAIAYDSQNEQFHVAMARIHLKKATELSQTEKPDIQAIGRLVERAVTEARQATTIAPRSVIVWENLGIMYENAASLIPEARKWAVDSYEKAVQLEPTNPVIVTKLGENHALNNNLNEAAKTLEQAIVLKRDYVPAYVSLGTVYEQLKDVDKAIAVYAALASLQPNNVEYAYNLGRMAYNRNTGDDRQNAKNIWESIVAVEPRYSNALYSLALLHENRGEKSKALEYYNKVLELNPENKDIKNKITNLSR